MPTLDITKDLDGCTMTVETGFDRPIERVWQLWADPRQLERWWGPPTYPATVTDHDLSVGGRVVYFMTGPEGDRHGGGWRVTAVEAPRLLEVVDFFLREDGEENTDLPSTTMSVRLSERADGGTSVVIVSGFPSREAMEQLISMGLEEGLAAAMGQMDAVLAD